MKKTKFSTWVGTGMLASSLLLLPATTSLFAQTANPAPPTRPVETRDHRDNTGLWGLLGLAGLLGLTGLGRRSENVRAYTDPRERNKV